MLTAVMDAVSRQFGIATNATLLALTQHGQREVVNGQSYEVMLLHKQQDMATLVDTTVTSECP
jgi:hypothetical protein